jgi:choline kinase
MTAVIMVAGVGSRLKKQVKHLPKCLLTFGGESILSRNLRLLREHNVTRIVVVAGYKATMVKEEIGEQAKYVFNPFFRVTNSLASLWFAHQHVDLYDDLLIFNGDVIYEEEVLKAALSAQHPATMLIDSSVIDLADYRLAVEGGYVINQGKDLSNEGTSGEYVGIVALHKDFVPLYLRRVADLVEQRERHDMWWEEALFEIRNDFRMKIHVSDVNGLFWAEADFIEDVQRIEQWFKTGVAPRLPIQVAELIQGR